MSWPLLNTSLFLLALSLGGAFGRPLGLATTTELIRCSAIPTFSFSPGCKVFPCYITLCSTPAVAPAVAAPPPHPLKEEEEETLAATLPSPLDLELQRGIYLAAAAGRTAATTTKADFRATTTMGGLELGEGMSSASPGWSALAIFLIFMAGALGASAYFVRRRRRRQRRPHKAPSGILIDISAPAVGAEGDRERRRKGCGGGAPEIKLEESFSALPSPMLPGGADPPSRPVPAVQAPLVPVHSGGLSVIGGGGGNDDKSLPAGGRKAKENESEGKEEIQKRAEKESGDIFEWVERIISDAGSNNSARAPSCTCSTTTSSSTPPAPPSAAGTSSGEGASKRDPPSLSLSPESPPSPSGFLIGFRPVYARKEGGESLLKAPPISARLAAAIQELSEVPPTPPPPPPAAASALRPSSTLSAAAVARDRTSTSPPPPPMQEKSMDSSSRPGNTEKDLSIFPPRSLETAASCTPSGASSPGRSCQTSPPPPSVSGREPNHDRGWINVPLFEVGGGGRGAGLQEEEKSKDNEGRPEEEEPGESEKGSGEHIQSVPNVPPPPPCPPPPPPPPADAVHTTPPLPPPPPNPRRSKRSGAKKSYCQFFY